MKNFLQKLSFPFWRKKPLPWYKRIFKKTAVIIDMKRRYKFLTFFVLLFVAGWLCLPSLGGIIKNMIREYGSAVLGTSVSVRRISVKPTLGEGSVRGIRIANPHDYKSKYLLTLDSISVKVDLASVTSDTIIVQNITIDRPVISYEMLSLTQNNISDILENIKKNTASEEDTDKTTENKESQTEEKKIIIRTLTVRNGQIDLMAGIGKLKQALSVPLPEITLKDLGAEKREMTMREALSDVLTKILTTAGQAVTATQLDKLGSESVDLVKETGQSALDAGKNAFDGVKNLFK